MNLDEHKCSSRRAACPDLQFVELSFIKFTFEVRALGSIILTNQVLLNASSNTPPANHTQVFYFKNRTSCFWGYFSSFDREHNFLAKHCIFCSVIASSVSAL